MSEMKSRNKMLEGLLKGVASGHPDWNEWSQFVFTSFESIISDISLLREKNKEELNILRKEFLKEIKDVNTTFADDIKKLTKDVIRMGVILTIGVSVSISVVAAIVGKYITLGIFGK